MRESNHLQNKIFDVVLYVITCVSIVSIIGNLLTGFPLSVNIKWLILIITSSIYLFVRSRGKKTDHLKFLFYTLIVFVIIPYGWFDSGGSNNNSIAYIFIAMICISFIFTGKERLFLAGGLIGAFIVLYSLEYYYPGLVKVHSEHSQFLDRLIQIPFTLGASFLIIKKFSDTFSKEHTQINAYSNMLKEANDKLDFIAKHDALTNLHNRRAFDEALQEQIEEKLNPYIVFIDIDKFKAINDVHGHHIGDQCIQRIADLITVNFDNTHFVSRWGGDEFAIICNTSKLDLLSRLSKVKSEALKTTPRHPVQMTISIGITQLHDQDVMDMALKRADQLLYQAKENGRNQYKIG